MGVGPTSAASAEGVRSVAACVGILFDARRLLL